MKCERCENDVPVRSRFCPACGAVVGAAPGQPALVEKSEPAVVVATVGGGTATVPASMLFAATNTENSEAEPAGAGSAAGRRRRVDRPAMVPLSEFGKEPPPPPRAPLSARSIAIGVAIAVGVIALVVIVVAIAAPQANAVWGNVSKLDQRTNR